MRRVALAILAALAISACTEADTVSRNLSKGAEEFEINRRVVFYNGITDTYMLTIEGRCSIEDQNDQLSTVCKVGDNQYKKHFLGLSDNVSYFVEQLDVADANEYQYRVVFRPEIIVPEIDLETSGDLEGDG